MKRIADTGLLKALLDRSDMHHLWAAEQFRIYAPFHTCEAVLDELAFLVANPRPGVKLVARGDLILDFQLADHIAEVLEILQKYADRPIDLADACIVRMTELDDRCKVWTTDARDFKTFRRHRRQPIPVETPST